MEWLTSGLRRDICILLYDEDYRVQSLKSDLESRYGRRLQPKRFHGAVSKLESAGYLQRRADGLHDRCVLTDEGRGCVEAQFEWMREELGVGGETSR
ncbi:MAG: PadR family transcriptional regulator [Natronomonas sp.]